MGMPKTRTTGVRSKAKVSGWGNSLGVRIPKEMAAEIGLRDGSEVSIEARGGAVVVRPLRVRRRYTTAELCAGATPAAVGGELWSGPAVGKEIW